ncbi:hypothetical protein BD309DRAFT_952934 [Dichomitus squalens]|nr:hypothetical protein BD309DRAFT_952934 [Dichomitus squalens]
MASPATSNITAVGTPPGPLTFSITIPALDNTYGAIMLGTFGGLMCVVHISLFG